MRATSGSRKRRKSAKLEMAPMVDVVFQLLIFFLVASEVRPTEADFKTNMPADGPPPWKEREKLEPARLEMEQTAGRLFVRLNGSEIVDGGVPVSDDARARNVFGLLTDRLKKAGENPVKVLYVIDGSPDLEVKYMAMALDAGIEAGVHKITLGRPDSARPRNRRRWGHTQ